MWLSNNVPAENIAGPHGTFAHYIKNVFSDELLNNIYSFLGLVAYFNFLCGWFSELWKLFPSCGEVKITKFLCKFYRFLNQSKTLDWFFGEKKIGWDKYTLETWHLITHIVMVHSAYFIKTGLRVSKQNSKKNLDSLRSLYFYYLY